MVRERPSILAGQLHRPLTSEDGQPDFQNILPDAVIRKIDILFQQYEPSLQRYVAYRENLLRQGADPGPDLQELYYQYWELAVSGQMPYNIASHHLVVWFGTLR